MKLNGLLRGSLYRRILGHKFLKDQARVADPGSRPELSKDSLINGAGFSYNTVQKRMENSITERTIGLPDGFIRGTADQIRSGLFCG